MIYISNISKWIILRKGCQNVDRSGTSPSRRKSKSLDLLQRLGKSFYVCMELQLPESPSHLPRILIDSVGCSLVKKWHFQRCLEKKLWIIKKKVEVIKTFYFITILRHNKIVCQLVEYGPGMSSRNICLIYGIHSGTKREREQNLQYESWSLATQGKKTWEILQVWSRLICSFSLLIRWRIGNVNQLGILPAQAIVFIPHQRSFYF